jgi:hypothetical protein
MLKVCKGCNESLPIDVFVKDRRNKDGRGSRCKPCVNAAAVYNPDRQRKYKLKHFYGITPDKYNEMYVEQEGACEICLKKFSKLHVDHCHDSGKVRGLLCHNCNVALGHLGDNLSILQNAISYLAKHA